MTIARVPVDITWDGSGSPGVNVWHLRVDGPLNGSDQIAGLLEDLETFYETAKNACPASVDFDFRGEIQGLGPDTGDTAVYDAWHQDASGTGNYAPTMTCQVVGWRTNSGGRRGRGRTFIGPVATSVVAADGSPSAAYLSDLQAAADALVAAGAPIGNGSWGVYSVLDQVVRDFTGATVSPKFGSLRSRRD